MSLEFEWDEDKARSNMKKHRVTFEEAESAFSDPISLTIYDEEHSVDEARYVLIGESDRSRLLVISFTERGDRYRIISARVANRPERKQYEEAQ